MQINSNDLKNTIYFAFSGRIYPGDDRILGRSAPYVLRNRYDRTDDEEDPIPFVGKKWQDIDATFFFGENWNENIINILPQCRMARHSMTDEAFCYYLPAYMINIIDHYYPMDLISDSIVYSLLLDKDKKTKEYWNWFNRDEVMAIIRFLEYINQEYSDNYPNEDFIGTLNNYWYPRLRELSV